MMRCRPSGRVIVGKPQQKEVDRLIFRFPVLISMAGSFIHKHRRNAGLQNTGLRMDFEKSLQSFKKFLCRRSLN